MMVILSPQALDDLADIADVIGIDDAGRAKSFVEELRIACRELDPFPRRFPAFPLAGPNARRRSYGNYAIIYDVGYDDVTIVAVVHGARDLDALFR